MSRLLLVAMMLIGLTGSVLAQAPQTRIRGSIAGFDGSVLTINGRDGTTVKLTLPADLQPSALKRLSIETIEPNSFIATVAEPAADGSLKAVYVAVFPESQRGTGEGHYDWDLAPGSTMTNATVTSVLKASAGRKLSLVYKGQPIEITVPPNAPIIQTIPATRADLKPGAKVFIVATTGADGSLTPRRITVGKDGIDPPQ